MTEREGVTSRIFIAAGEVSGDRQAAYLARALRSQDPGIELYGSGGNRMREAGIDVRIQTSHLGCVGFQESLRYLHPLRKIMSSLHNLVLQDPPDLAVLVDNEGFNGMLAKFLGNRGIPFVYYFPPQVWLWGEWRARAIASRANLIIPAFQAESEIYQREGGTVQWFGHPLLDIVKPETDFHSAATASGLDPDRPILAIMPGSRFQEVEQLTSSLLGAARTILEKRPQYQIILPLAAPHLLSVLEQQIQAARMTDRVTIITQNVYTLLANSRLALLSSGTATLELALLGVPMVVGYRVKPVTYFLGKYLLRTRFIAMPNILLDQSVVPELIQDRVNSDRFATEAERILDDQAHANWIRSQLARIRPKLGYEGVLSRAASAILAEARKTQLMARAEVLQK
ncbi:MAG TPA: lipid-A-disaccharide synthase [Bacteroidota bacterium]|nr:lipid-A-disaccharide synthase [Bacteroidota bacterium]